MITRQQRTNLSARGFAPEEIDRMTPEEAQAELANPAFVIKTEPPATDEAEIISPEPAMTTATKARPAPAIIYVHDKS